MNGPTQVAASCLNCCILEEFGDDANTVSVELWQTLGEMQRHFRSTLFSRILEAIELSQFEPVVCVYEIVDIRGLKLIEQVRMPGGKWLKRESSKTVTFDGCDTEVVLMLIRVQYEDKSFGTVDDTSLEPLIEDGRIVAFERSSGWVRIGVDPVRSPRVERRRKGAILNIYV